MFVNFNETMYLASRPVILIPDDNSSLVDGDIRLDLILIGADP